MIGECPRKRLKSHIGKLTKPRIVKVVLGGRVKLRGSKTSNREEVDGLYVKVDKGTKFKTNKYQKKGRNRTTKKKIILGS